MKEICKNCEHCKPTYKSYYCDRDKAKKTRLQDTCEKWGEEKEMTPREVIKLIKNRLVGNQYEREVVNMVIDALEQYWRPIRSDDDLPPLDEDGYSEKLLVSFANATDPEIGEYRRKEDGSGGAFYVGDLDETFTQHGLRVNAWMPLPQSYRG